VTAKAWNMAADFTANACKQRKKLNQSLRSALSESQLVPAPNDAANRYPEHPSMK
jgi:hypothetical protein